MNIKLSFCLILSVCCFSFSQNKEQSDNRNYNQWFISNYLGFSTIENADNFKINTTVYGGFLGKEFSIGNNVAIVTGLDHHVIRGHPPYYDQAVYQKFNFIAVPVLFRFTAFNSGSTNLFVSGGAYLSYLYRLKTEMIINGESTISKDLGYNVGVALEIGYEFIITKTIKINFGLISRSDFYSNYKDQMPAIRVRDLHGIQFGIGFDLN